MVFSFTIRQCPSFVLAGLLSLMPVAVQADSDNRSKATTPAIQEASLIYVSDYFSFIGRDCQGHVALALDNNRGRDGESYQAEILSSCTTSGKGGSSLPATGPTRTVGMN